MHDNMECYWFKPSKHEVTHQKLQNSQNKTKFKINKPTKRSQQNIIVLDTWNLNARNAQWNAFHMKNI